MVCLFRPQGPKVCCDLGTHGLWAIRVLDEKEKLSRLNVDSKLMASESEVKPGANNRLVGETRDGDAGERRQMLTKFVPEPSLRKPVKAVVHGSARETD